MLHLSPEKIALNAAHFGDTGPRKMVLRQDQSPGDILTFTRALCDLKEAYPQFLIDVDTPCPEIFENNPHITPLDAGEPDVEHYSVRYSTINDSGWRGHHFADAFRMDLERLLGVPIPSQGLRPQLFISEEERGWFHLPHVAWGWDSDFWLISAGFKRDNECKAYTGWQEVADRFNDHFQGRVRLVQIGHPAHVHPPLNGVYNAVGKTDNLRQLIRLAYWCKGIMSPISLAMVLAQSLDLPAVIVAAGKEGANWHRVSKIRFLDTLGCLPCCQNDGCWKGGEMGQCLDLVGDPPRPHCFDMVRPEDVVRNAIMYYEGGVLAMPEGEGGLPYGE